MQDSDSIQCFRSVGCESVENLEFVQGSVCISGVPQNLGNRPMCADMIGNKFDNLAVGLQRYIIVAHINIGICKIEISGRVFRRQRDGLMQYFHRLIRTPCSTMCRAKVGQYLAVCWIAGAGACHKFDSVFRVVLSEAYRTQNMKRVRVLGMAAEH